MEIKKRLQKGLVGIVLPCLMAVSGCSMSSMLRKAISPEEKPQDKRNSLNVLAYKESADEKAKSDNLNDLGNAMRGYGCICELEKMKEVIRKIIRKDTEIGFEYDTLGDKYREMCGK